MESPRIEVTTGVEILVVEDSRTQAERLRHILDGYGYRISIALDGKMALASLSRHKPTIVVSDVIMPEMDGYQLCRRIKADESLREIPVILLTALSDPRDIIQGLECGADSFITKPYDEKYLVSRIQHILANRELRKGEKVHLGVEILFAGQRYFITSERQQILDLLLSTYETAIQKNLEVVEARDELKTLNEHLERMVDERTAALRAENAERKRAEEDSRQQLTRISLLNQIIRAIAERQDLQSIFRAVLQQLEDHLPIDLGGVALFDPGADTLTITAYGPKSQPLAAELGLPEGMVIAIDQTGLRACVQGETVYAADSAEMDAPMARRLAQAGIRSLMVTPLAVEGEVFGLLKVARREADRFSSAEGEFLRMLSEHVSLAAHQARLYQDLRKAYDDLRRTQQAAMQQERLRALGQMASGIAHDVNNSLSPVVGFTDLLLTTEPNLSERTQQYLEDIRTAGMDIAHIVARMREFYRQRERKEELAAARLNPLVRQVLDLTRPRWKDIPQEQGAAIEMHTELAPDLPSVSGIESEIREALVNLIFNAVDAMPRGGLITVRTRLAPTSPHVVLEVGDTGVGMGEETRQHCLEPFYSTKGERGTGLGLAMVYGVMQRHEGNIEIESALGQGTTIRLIFPIHGAVGPGTPLPDESLEALRPLRILYIDDEPPLRRLVKEMLESEGHAVEVADGGQAGLDAFRGSRERGEPFDLIITDLGMPYVDGREVARAVKHESPGSPVVLLTGWGGRMNTESAIPAQVDAILSKPPRLKELRETLAQVLRTVP